METSVNNKTGADFQAKRVALGLTQEKLAHKARVSVACVSMAERTGKLYDTVSGRRLARRLKVPVAELLPLSRKRREKVLAGVALLRPIDCDGPVTMGCRSRVGEPKGKMLFVGANASIEKKDSFQKHIPRAVVAIGDLFQGVES